MTDHAINQEGLDDAREACQETHVNETCRDCHGPIHWVDSQDCWYHDSTTDMLGCPSIDVEPARVTA